jgi:DNA-directed RNA polymerase specialized sigma24 family protein
MPLATMLSRFFVQNRPPWQRAALAQDLEAEGFLALTRAARTYDKSKLPYPKAYFARACLNGMYKSIKKLTRQPGVERLTLEQAADMLPDFDQLDYLRLAIDDLDGDDQELASDRFRGGLTLQALAERHQIPLREASRRASRLAKILGESLGIQLQRPDRGASNHPGRSTRDFPASSAVSAHPSSRTQKR